MATLPESIDARRRSCLSDAAATSAVPLAGAGVAYESVGAGGATAAPPRVVTVTALFDAVRQGRFISEQFVNERGSR